MDPQHALRILEDLRHRIDPGSPAPLAHVEASAVADLVPALDAALGALAVAAAHAEARARRPANVGRAWRPEDEEALLEAFDAGGSVTELAERFGRTVASIESRLERLGRLAPEQRRTRSRYPVRPAATAGRA